MNDSMKNSTLDYVENVDLNTAEDIIKNNLNGCARNFVAIGFYLKDIRDNETYLKGGYDNIWDFAKDRLQMAKSTVSRFMAINDRFSVDGNTPNLKDEYLEFGSGKLQEMLTLTDKEIEKINADTTVKEIRDMKKKRCDAQQKTNVFEESAKQIYCPEIDHRILNDITKWCIKKLKDDIEMQIEVHGFDSSMEQLLIMKLQTNALRPINNYSVFFSKTYVKITDHEFNKTENLLYMDIDAEIHRIWYEEVTESEAVVISTFEKDGSAYGWTWSEIVKSLIKEMIKENMCIDEFEEGTENVFKSLGKTYVACCFDERYITIQNDNCESIFKIAMDRFEAEYKYCSSVIETEKTVIEEPESVIDEVETVGADIIESETISPRNDIGKDEGIKDILRIQPTRNEDDPNCPAGMGPCIEGCNWKPSGLTADEAEWICRNCWSDYLMDLISKDRDVRESLVDVKPVQPEVNHKYQINPKDERFEMVPHQINAAWGFFDKKDYESTDFYLFNARKDLWENYEFDRGPIVPDIHEGKSKQPELPILKNNDQRKEFIEAYETWPIWIDTVEIGERYYRYEFDNNTSFVIKVSTCHKWNNSGGYDKEKTYGHERYYIIGVENKEKYKPKDPTFCESEMNKTALIDYLKEIQKKGAQA